MTGPWNKIAYIYKLLEPYEEPIFWQHVSIYFVNMARPFSSRHLAHRKMNVFFSCETKHKSTCSTFPLIFGYILTFYRGFLASSLDNSGLLCPHVSSKLSGKVNTFWGRGSTKQTASQDFVEGHSHDFESGIWPPGSHFVSDALHFKFPLCFSVFFILCTDKWYHQESFCIDFGDRCVVFFFCRIFLLFAL